MRLKILFVLAACLMFTGTQGCLTPGDDGPGSVVVNPPPGSLLLDSSVYAADALYANVWYRISPESMVTTVSFVNLGDLDRTSGFGRVVSQQIGSRLAQYGFAVVEGRIRNNMAYRVQEGEFMLSREAAKLLMTEHYAQAALVGAYTVSSDKVFVSVRLVSLESGALIGAYEYYVQNRGEVAELATDDAGFSGWEQNVRRKPAFSGPSQVQ